jgi:hypothetical protein
MFEPMADFDWRWQRKLDREAVEELFQFGFIVFPHAACVVTLVGQLIYRAEVIEIEADSYRLKEAKELSAARTKQRRGTKH